MGSRIGKIAAQDEGGVGWSRPSGQYQLALHKVQLVQSISFRIYRVEQVMTIFQFVEVPQHGNIAPPGHTPRQYANEFSTFVVQSHYSVARVIAHNFEYYVTRKWIRSCGYCHPFRYCYK
jgi:hypothetical protein